MLKDGLTELAAKKGTTYRPYCKFGDIICAQDQETQTLLISTMCGETVSTMDIVRLLKAEDFPIGREFLGQQRRFCFRAEGVPKNCCIAEKIEAYKNENQ